MKKYLIRFFKCITLAIAMVIFANVATAQTQTTLYSTDFGTNSAFPTGWTASGGSTQWSCNTTSASSGYTGASSSDNADNGTSGTATLIYNNNLSTVSYTSINVIWGARMTSSGSAPTFQWSADGSTWNTVSYTDVANNSTWALINGRYCC
jgi:hypothetical protein